jgi:Protein of unknown function (DUF2586)
MPLSSLTINVGSAGIGRRPINRDKVSGILFYAASYPTGLSSGTPAARCYNIQDVQTLGITSTDAVFKSLWYQCSEYFRINPNGELWVGVYPPGTYTFAEIKSLADAAAGDIRQMGVYASARAYSSVATDLATQAAIVATCDAVYEHMSVIYAPNCAAVASGWGSAVNIRTTAAGSKLSVIIAQDGGGTGAALYTALTYSVPMLGACLGALSKAAVNQSIGNPQNFNISNGTECEVLALANGQLITAVGNTTLGSLKDTGHIIARKYVPQYSGSFFERIPTSTISTDTYAWIEVVRAIDKAKRTVETTLTPSLQSVLNLKSDGTLRDDTIGYFSDLCVNAMNNMKAAGEISDFQILINPAQNVLSTSTLAITCKIIPTGTAEFITVNIGLYTNF